jgi:hypothetical protein
MEMRVGPSVGTYTTILHQHELRTRSTLSLYYDDADQQKSHRDCTAVSVAKFGRALACPPRQQPGTAPTQQAARSRLHFETQISRPQPQHSQRATAKHSCNYCKGTVMLWRDGTVSCGNERAGGGHAAGLRAGGGRAKRTCCGSGGSTGSGLRKTGSASKTRRSSRLTSSAESAALRACSRCSRSAACGSDASPGVPSRSAAPRSPHCRQRACAARDTGPVRQHRRQRLACA